ncbi:MAG TPA: hypothetical protein PLN21_07500 [Gemmatales bacterium]|nr:hypothetical protein [Gemmatales bacterium]
MHHVSLMRHGLAVGWIAAGVVLTAIVSYSLKAQESSGKQASPNAKTTIPETWDEARLASLQVPLAHAGVSARHVSKEYYTSLPVRPIYKSYDVYRPDLEPKGYLDWLKKLEPEVEWDETKSPALNSEADWIKAGELVFDSSLGWGNGAIMGPYEGMQVRDPEWYKNTQAPLTSDGKLPFYRYVIRTKGRVEVTRLSCAMCHTRVLPDKTVVKGAQGNFPFGRAVAYDTRKTNSADFARSLELLLFGAPWLRPDPLAGLGKKSVEDIASAHALVPAGVLARHGSGVWSPVQVPDLIGIQHRMYLDRTGLIRHRDIGDLMRYAALNQDADSLARHGSFRPIAAFNKDFLNKLPPPAPAGEAPGGRYSDVQLFALAKYVYSLKPPENPNLPKTNAERERVARGAKLFSESGCVKCHDPKQGYTNNKLARAPGFTVPGDHPEKANILAQSVGTDSTLTLRTRRGTGLYKVPSIQGVWYRGPFEHNGSVATLEDWLDPKRLEDGYVPTGWKGPPGMKTRAVVGHEFGLDLPADDRKALIAFLKTL